MLKSIKPASRLPWVCIGDFNEVLHRLEHVGVQERSYAQIEGFRDMVDVCGLGDLGYEGRSWTYEKKVTVGTYCRVRLDRALATSDWSARFPLAKVRHLTAAASDHGPIVLQWGAVPRRTHRRGRFRYETIWETHEDFATMIVEEWQSGAANTVQELHSKLTCASSKLSRWGTCTFGHLRRELSKLKVDLENLQADPQRQGPSHMELKIVERIKELNHREELMWK